MQEEEIHWFPFGSRCPYTKHIKIHKDGLLVFNGYFYLEDQTMPVKRIMCLRKKMLLVEIISKKTLEDTSVYGEYDEDLGGRACFFPTNNIEIQYKVLKEIENNAEFHKLCNEIEAQEVEVSERNAIHKEKREQKEHEELMERCKNMDYKKFFESLRDDDPCKGLDDM